MYKWRENNKAKYDIICNKAQAIYKYVFCIINVKIKRKLANTRKSGMREEKPKD